MSYWMFTSFLTSSPLLESIHYISALMMTSWFAPSEILHSHVIIWHLSACVFTIFGSTYPPLTSPQYSHLDSKLDNLGCLYLLPLQHHLHFRYQFFLYHQSEYCKYLCSTWRFVVHSLSFRTWSSMSSSVLLPCIMSPLSLTTIIKRFWNFWHCSCHSCLIYLTCLLL